MDNQNSSNDNLIDSFDLGKNQASVSFNGHFNPGNEAFKMILNSGYVDKTGLISIINNTIGTTYSLTCISRPRRFGKSYAAQMLSAYYDCSCDSRSIFDGLTVSKDKSYEAHINQYNVLYLDITSFISARKSKNKDLTGITLDIISTIKNEIALKYPQIKEITKLSDCLMRVKDITGRKFVFIIDEWDAVVREASDRPDIQDAYFNLLRELFKNGNFTPYVIAAAYMTGILPIKKDGTESAISDFNEYTILNPGVFAQYSGFTEKEVESLCENSNVDYSTMKAWYDGYVFDDEISIYNPYSVMKAIQMRRFESYWQKTSAVEGLTTYINMNYDGLQDDILRLIAGEHLEVDVDGFGNDVKNFRNKDDVITLLIHLGYLAYDADDKTVRIPNKEVRSEFNMLIKNSNMNKLKELVDNSNKLLDATIAGDETAVADRIEAIRKSDYAPNFYNDEQALRYVIKFAYIACVDKYKDIQELPSGKGIADVVFIPKKTTMDPAIIVELKWNKSSEAALKQIKDKDYPEVLRDFVGEAVLVGINYDEKTKQHSCKIERLALT